jgi:hypothetical protein
LRIAFGVEFFRPFFWLLRSTNEWVSFIINETQYVLRRFLTYTRISKKVFN